MANLIQTISQVKEYINVSNGLSIATLRPALNEVERQTLTYYLGADLLAEVIAQENTVPKVLTPRIALIHPYVMGAACSLAIFKAGPEIEVMVSDTGIQRQESDQMKTAFGGQVKRMLDTAASRGYADLDQLLLLLEANADDYPEWQDSQYYDLRKDLFIRSAAEFETSGENIKGSSLTFQAFRPLMLEVQENQIRTKMPDAMYEDLKANPTTTANEFLLKNYIRPAIAKLVMEEALTTLPIEIDHEGVHINQLTDGGRTKSAASLALIEKKAWGLRGRGNYYLDRMKEYLNQNATVSNYPLWFSSDFYSETLAQQIERDSIPAHERRIYRN